MFDIFSIFLVFQPTFTIPLLVKIFCLFCTIKYVRWWLLTWYEIGTQIVICVWVDYKVFSSLIYKFISCMYTMNICEIYIILPFKNQWTLNKIMAYWVKIMTWQVFLLQEHRNELELIQENAFCSPPKSVDREYSLR